MDAVTTIIGTTITATVIVFSSLFGGTTAPAETNAPVSICVSGSGGIVPPSSTNTKCDKD